MPLFFLPSAGKIILKKNLFFFAIFCGKKVKIVTVRDGQTENGAGKLLKPAFGPWTVPLTHTAPQLVHTGREEKKKKEKKNGQQQRNNKNFYVFVYVCA